MVIDIVEDEAYKQIIEKQIFEQCKYLIENDEEFSITANIKAVSFNPEVPTVIAESFQPFTMFSLMNYTFTSIELNETEISFETGFGAENFGSVVTVPLYSIFQIIIDESILFLNPVATVDKFVDQKENQQQRSMNAFSMNKKNKNLL